VAALAGLALAGCTGGNQADVTTPPAATSASASTQPAPSATSTEGQIVAETATPSPTATGSAEWTPQGAAGTAIDWLVGQLVDGDHQETTYDGQVYPDYGLTVDTLFALEAAGRFDEAAKVAAWLVQPDNLIAYLGDGEMALYPGAVGKLGLALNSPGLYVTLEGQAAPEAMVEALTGRLADTGRFQDISEFGDYSTPVGQALAIMFLAQQGKLEGLAPDPVAFLATAQCEDGGFPSTFEYEEGCESDPDTTAFVVQALAVAGGHEDAVTTAVTHLINFQLPNGHWSSFDAEAPNSVGLAVAVLSQVDSEEARAAVSLGLQALEEWQLPDGAFPAADSAEGDARATAQAVLGLVQVDFPTLAGLVAP
jgi:hypothetical protein